MIFFLKKIGEFVITRKYLEVFEDVYLDLKIMCKAIVNYYEILREAQTYFNIQNYVQATLFKLLT